MSIENRRYKPQYKYFLNLRENVTDNSKLLKFKKKKWKNLIQRLFNIRRRKYNKTYFSHASYQITRNAKPLRSGFRSFLATKKRLNLFYGRFTESKFKSEFEKASIDAKKISGLKRKEDLLISTLESRLDTILFRSYFLSSFRHIRQLISHGKILVNGKKTANYNYLVKPGDIITLDFKIHSLVKNTLLKAKLQRIIPSYLQVSYKTLTIIMVKEINISYLAQLFPFWVNLKNIFYNYSY
jgi:small subunit ribosomal protein S4